MSPLITPGSEFDLLWAFIIGIGFGFILEAAGFSTSRKIVGLFYGYDFTVIKVFFTAAVTASTGILLFNHLGYVDYGSIYVPTTFLWPTVVGGIFMGLGFLIGGFCPGTSVCAAAIGKLDALAFVGGIFGGIFFYTMSFETLWMEFRTTSNLGVLQLSDVFGLPLGVMILIFSVFSIITFVVVSKIKQNIKNVEY
ncbi:MAG: YeeE/YedE thiosulfate transporter family protein [Bacteroidota bacterium]